MATSRKMISRRQALGGAAAFALGATVAHDAVLARSQDRTTDVLGFNSHEGVETIDVHKAVIVEVHHDDLTVLVQGTDKAVRYPARGFPNDWKHEKDDEVAACLDRTPNGEKWYVAPLVIFVEGSISSASEEDISLVFEGRDVNAKIGTTDVTSKLEELRSKETVADSVRWVLVKNSKDNTHKGFAVVEI